MINNKIHDHIKNRLTFPGIFSEKREKLIFKTSPEPFYLSNNELDTLQKLGGVLYSFYNAANRLYFESVNGRIPVWFYKYLDAGKPEHIIKLGRLNRTKIQIPGIIRPDIILTDDGFTICELDSVPGGFGTLTCLTDIYKGLGYNCAGSADGIIKGFHGIFAGNNEHPVIAIIVSNESEDYRPEMAYFAETLRKHGFEAYTVSPGDIIFEESGIYLAPEGKGKIKVNGIYRFFELFDLENIPKNELLVYALKKKMVSVSPPYKPFLEEKLLLALFHHPMLKKYWIAELGEESFQFLKTLFPETWILDPGLIPPHAVIPNLEIAGEPVGNWETLKKCSRQEREFVIKISGYSPSAWGSKGVYAGHDLPSERWSEIIDMALENFSKTPYILQRFKKGRKIEYNCFNQDGSITANQGRVRLSPYYFVNCGKTDMAGVLATICPSDKVYVHGMPDAVMVPVGSK